MFPLLPPTEAKNILETKAVICLGDVIRNQSLCSRTRVSDPYTCWPNHKQGSPVKHDSK